MKSVSDTIKSIIIVSLVILLGALASSKLMKLQIVGDDNIAASPKYESGAYTFTRKIKPTRGEILDYNGNVLIGNDTRCDLVMQKAFFPDDLKEGNNVLYEICNKLQECGYAFPEALPITVNEPYEFTEDDVSEVTELLNLNVYATAENCIDKIISDYEISDIYTPLEKRLIAGIDRKSTRLNSSHP